MLTRLVALLRSRHGTAATEFAILAPIMILLTAGIVEFGRAFQVYNALNRLGTQYAIAWSDCPDTPIGAGTCGIELATYTVTNAVKNIVPQLTGTVTLSMFQVEMQGTTPKTPTYAYPSGASLSPLQISEAAKVLADKQIGVIVTVAYQHSLAYFPNQMSTFLPSSVLNPSFTVVQLKT